MYFVVVVHVTLKHINKLTNSYLTGNYQYGDYKFPKNLGATTKFQAPEW